MPDWKNKIRLRLAGLELEPAREAAIIEELAQYLDDYYAELLAGGAPETEAMRRTLAELGESDLFQRGLLRLERQTASDPIQLGTNRRSTVIADFWQDLHFGARMLLKKPAFTLITVVTLALGMGANTAIFSMVNAVLIRPLPYQEPGQLVILDENPPGGGQYVIAPGNFVDWLDQSESFTGMAAFRGISLNLTGEGEAERLRGQRLSANCFALLRVKPVLGRDFLPEEEKPEHRNVVMLSNELWQRRFGGKPDLVGKTLTLDGNGYTVIGVMPQDFRFFGGTDVWIPLALTPSERVSHDKHDFSAIARLKPGISLEQARAEMNTIAGRLGVQQTLRSSQPSHCCWRWWRSSPAGFRHGVRRRSIR